MDTPAQTPKTTNVKHLPANRIARRMTTRKISRP